MGGTKYAPPLLECMYNIIASLETMYLKRLKNITIIKVINKFSEHFKDPLFLKTDKTIICQHFQL